jgi:hypothetical protein
MADKKISQLTAATAPLDGTELVPIVQSGSTVKVPVDDLTVKNLRSNATTGILQVVGPGAGTTRTMTTPNANFTAARTDAGQSFTGSQDIVGDLRLINTQATINLWKDGTPTKASQITFNTARADGIAIGVFNGLAWSYGFSMDANANALVGDSTLTTTSTKGFAYVATCSGTPTGTPDGILGFAPIVIDTTNHKLYFYSGGQWRDAGP